VRSNKTKKKKQQTSWIDPITGIEMYGYEDGYQGGNGMGSIMDDGMQAISFNQQVQDLLS
jgi:hypothetical protein